MYDPGYMNQFMKRVLKEKNKFSESIWDLLDELEKKEPEMYEDTCYASGKGDLKDALALKEIDPSEIVELFIYHF